MYKTELIKRVARQTRLSQKAVSDVVGASVDMIEDALAKGQTVQIPGFGTFYTRKRSEAQARDFKTGEKISVPEMRLAGFRAGALLRRAVRKPPVRKGRKKVVAGNV